jgi:hypothetical protein
MADTVLFSGKGEDGEEFSVIRRENGDACTVGNSREIAIRAAGELHMYRRLFEKALHYADKVFQVCSENPKPLLPNFLPLGADKFEGVVILAEEYIKHTRTLETIENTCSGYARELATNRLTSRVSHGG